MIQNQTLLVKFKHFLVGNTEWGGVNLFSIVQDSFQ